MSWKPGDYTDHDRIQIELRNSPGMKLLRSETAPLVISFVHGEFKRPQRIAIPHGQLVEKLEDALESVNEHQPGLYPRTAQAYLETWCDDDHQFLRKYYGSGSDEPLFELTPETEKVLGWVEELNRSRFVGTESRFLRIFALLEEIVTRSTRDPAARLAQLERQQEAIRQEMEAIHEAGRVELYSSTQIKERFIEANDAARKLLADFREVERNFRDITRTVQEQQLKEGVRKGSVLGYVLDEHLALKESDQGRSFYGFWSFLMSQVRQEELKDLLDAVYGLPHLGEMGEEHQVLRGIKKSLVEAGEKVIQSNHRLAEQLRRMLDGHSLSENRRVLDLIAEIKKIALTLVDESPAESAFLELEGRPRVRMVMEKPLWDLPDLPDFQSHGIEVADDDDMDYTEMEGLYDHFHVNESLLDERIASMLSSRHEVTLIEIIERHPVRKGLSELLTYLAIAARDPRHEIDDSRRDQITLHVPDSLLDGQPERTLRIKLPRVVFRR